MKKNKNLSLEPDFIGTTVVGERGQVVVPKKVRDQLNLKPGTRLLVFTHLGGSVIMMPVEQMHDVMKGMTKQMSTIQKALNK
ncbi:MAG: AbrB/MazE/SpoVT family DNA-binding domain-containing protein [Patescibacteria group bacterium]|nr:AbrB/MazE/SpoVT family DNA-binding domain-containing protein [Patescibacteria group bacterium]